MSRPSAETLFCYYKPMPPTAPIKPIESTTYEVRIAALERDLASVKADLASVLAWKQKMLVASS